MGDLAREAMREFGQLGVVAKQHYPPQLVVKLVNDVEQVIRRDGMSRSSTTISLRL